MLPRVAFLAALCSVLVSPSVARAQDLASTIVGVWKAISVETKEVVYGKINRPFGDKPEGTWVFTRGGRKSLMLFHGDRKSPAAANATDAERVALFNSMTAYIGTYRVDGDKLIVTVDNSAIQSWNGTQRSTTITVSGTQFTSRAALFKAATTGLDVVTETTWQKVE
jgi:Lipocalin-like domain